MVKLRIGLRYLCTQQSCEQSQVAVVPGLIGQLNLGMVPVPFELMCLSQKQLASILRLRRAIEAYRPGQSLTRVSADAGYCDQSHFIREFRSVTGAAPRQFFLAGDYC